MSLKRGGKFHSFFLPQQSALSLQKKISNTPFPDYKHCRAVLLSDKHSVKWMKMDESGSKLMKISAVLHLHASLMLFFYAKL